MKHHSSDDYVRAAKDNHLSVEMGKNDHYKIYAPDGSMMVVPKRKDLAIGTDHTICKWFLRLGIVVMLLATITAIVVPHSILLALVGGG